MMMAAAFRMIITTIGRFNVTKVLKDSPRYFYSAHKESKISKNVKNFGNLLNRFEMSGWQHFQWFNFWHNNIIPWHTLLRQARLQYFQRKPHRVTLLANITRNWGYKLLWIKLISMITAKPINENIRNNLWWSRILFKNKKQGMPVRHWGRVKILIE